MNSELQTTGPPTATRHLAPVPRPARAASRSIIVYLCAEWKKVEANLGEISIPSWLLELPGRKRSESELARLAYASEVLRRPVASFNDLSMAEALRLVNEWKQQLGEDFKPKSVGYQGARRRQPRRLDRASDDELLKIGELAADLWGERWHELLGARLQDRFRVSGVRFLAPAQARSLVEELLQRLAVTAIADRHQPPIARLEIEAEKAVLRRKYFGGVIHEQQTP